jgi:hypothetical protein
MPVFVVVDFLIPPDVVDYPPGVVEGVAAALSVCISCINSFSLGSNIISVRRFLDLP